MTYTIERTDQEILIKLPIESTPMQVQAALDFLRYVELSIDNQVTDMHINQFVEESKVKWREDNESRYSQIENLGHP